MFLFLICRFLSPLDHKAFRHRPGLQFVFCVKTDYKKSSQLASSALLKTTCRTSRTRRRRVPRARARARVRACPTTATRCPGASTGATPTRASTPATCGTRRRPPTATTPSPTCGRPTWPPARTPCATGPWTPASGRPSARTPGPPPATTSRTAIIIRSRRRGRMVVVRRGRRMGRVVRMVSNRGMGGQGKVMLVWDVCVDAHTYTGEFAS
ncbi:hypothetical protein F5X96DRAFT_628963 [Biscogniauxia mediterranea]|nr:hypothetical protein F5X96DRAFT_628963 [Biscogniauxia mediterranea]